MKMIRIWAAAALLACSSMTQAQAPDVRAEARPMFARLIRFQTVNGGDEEVPKLVAYLSEQLRSAGFTQSDIEPVTVGKKMGLIARYRGAPGSAKKPVLFLAHMDVVDARREE